MEEQFWQFVFPETAFIRPPPKKVNKKEAPKKDKHIIWWTKRSPSLWEHVESQDLETQASETESKGLTRESASKSNISPNPPIPIPIKVNIPHKEQIPTFMYEFIEKVVDVDGDGHCGIRAIVVLRDMYIDDYQMICYQLQKAIFGEEYECYRRLIRSEHLYNEVLYALTSDSIGFRAAPPNKWMIMPDMIFLIAQRYKRVVVPLSIKKGRSETFFPQYGASSHRNRMMCFTHVNHNYFMMVYLKDGCPVSSSYEVVRDDYLYLVENLDPEEKVVVDKKVEDVVKIEKDENLNLDDCSIDPTED